MEIVRDETDGIGGCGDESTVLSRVRVDPSFAPRRSVKAYCRSRELAQTPRGAAQFTVEIRCSLSLILNGKARFGAMTGLTFLTLVAAVFKGRD